MNRRTLYIVLSRDLLSMRYLVGDRETARYEDVPQFAYDDNKKLVVEIGSAATEWAQMPGHGLFRAFQHPRVAVCDIDNTAKLMTLFLARLKQTGKGLLPVTHVIIHWRDDRIKDLTDIEKRGFLHLAIPLRTNPLGNGTAVCEYERELLPSEVNAAWNTSGEWNLSVKTEPQR